jgi:hypothetical protein
MKLFRFLLHRFIKGCKCSTNDIKGLDKHILRDVGVNKMDLEYQKDARLWQKLAS